MKQYTREDLIAELIKQIAEIGNQRQWALKHKISQVHVHEVLMRKKGIGSKMANALGFRKQTYFLRNKDIARATQK